MTLRALAIAASLTLPLQACGEPADAPQSDVGYEIVGKNQVKARLRDPESAQFTGVRGVRRGETTAICGALNEETDTAGSSAKLCRICFQRPTG